MDISEIQDFTSSARIGPTQAVVAWNIGPKEARGLISEHRSSKRVGKHVCHRNEAAKHCVACLTEPRWIGNDIRQKPSL